MVLILRNARRMRACGSSTSLLVAGSTPCMPATKMKSPALAPRRQVPSALMAPAGSSVLTPFGHSPGPNPNLPLKRQLPRQEEICTVRLVRLALHPSRFGCAEDVGLRRQHHLVKVLREHRRGEELDRAQRFLADILKIVAHRRRQHLHAAGAVWC